jgi:hypothetical protein
MLMNKHKKIMAGLLISLSLMALSAKGWVLEQWQRSHKVLRVLFALFVAVVFAAAFYVGIVPVFWEWGNWILINFG